MTQAVPQSAPAAAAEATPAQRLRTSLKAERERLKARYFRKPDPAFNLAENARLVDEGLRELWAATVDDPAAALVGVGGYGRGALFPHSDVDVLVLLPDGHAPNASIERFIHAMWDAGLDTGSSVRSVSECVEEAEKDVTVDTSLLEARIITGNTPLFV